jgi:phosphoglycolate phosphatase-like HAD superfamily hydrolase
LGRCGLARFFTGVNALDLDPRRRPAQLKSLAGSDAVTIVVGSTDVMLRSASAAELFLVGISSGPCIAARLHQAGATVVYLTLGILLDSLCFGATDLIRAGLRPLPLPTAG